MNDLSPIVLRRGARQLFVRRRGNLPDLSLHFSSPGGRSTPYDRQDFVALACRVQNVLFKYACARQAARAFFLRPAGA